jgi:hypothetical protein
MLEQDRCSNDEIVCLFEVAEFEGSAGWRDHVYIPIGVMRTMTYTKTQLVTIANALPVFRMRWELISDGYMNGIERNESPFEWQSQQDSLSPCHVKG